MSSKRPPVPRQYSIYLEVEALNPAEAAKQMAVRLRDGGFAADQQLRAGNYRHPDGRLLPYAPLPAGCELWTVDYTVDEGWLRLCTGYFAVPLGAERPAHARILDDGSIAIGHRGYLTAFPEGTRYWHDAWLEYTGDETCFDIPYTAPEYDP